MKYSSSDFYLMETESPVSFLMRPVLVLKKIYYSLILVVGCFKIIKNPYDTDVVIRAAQGLATPERFKVSQDFLRSLPGGEEIFNKIKEIEGLNNK